MSNNKPKTPRIIPLPKDGVEAPIAPEPMDEEDRALVASADVHAAEASAVMEAAAPVTVTPPPKTLSPIEQLVKDIVDRRELVAKPLDILPLKSRTGWVAAQQQAADELLPLERAYAQHLQDAAVTGIVTGPAERVKEFVALGKQMSSQVIEVECDAMYVRLGKAGVQALGDSRQFGSGQIGLILEEYASIGRELFFASLGGPRWVYDTVVPTFEDFVAAIRNGIRAGEDEDLVNRAFIRMEAYKQALAKGCTSNIIPVLVTKATPEEVPFLKTKLFNAAASIKLPDAPVQEATVKAFFKAMVDAAKRADAQQLPA